MVANSFCNSRDFCATGALNLPLQTGLFSAALASSFANHAEIGIQLIARRFHVNGALGALEQYRQSKPGPISFTLFLLSVC